MERQPGRAPDALILLILCVSATVKNRTNTKKKEKMKKRIKKKTGRRIGSGRNIGWGVWTMGPTPAPHPPPPLPPPPPPAWRWEWEKEREEMSHFYVRFPFFLYLWNWAGAAIFVPEELWAEWSRHVMISCVTIIRQLQPASANLTPVASDGWSLSNSIPPSTHPPSTHPPSDPSFTSNFIQQIVSIGPVSFLS